MTLFTFSQVHFVGALSTWSVAHGYSDRDGMITGTCHTAHTLHSSHATFYIIPDTSAMIALPQTRSCIRLNCIGLLRSNDWLIVMAMSSQGLGVDLVKGWSSLRECPLSIWFFFWYIFFSKPWNISSGCFFFDFFLTWVLSRGKPDRGAANAGDEASPLNCSPECPQVTGDESIYAVLSRVGQE